MKKRLRSPKPCCRETIAADRDAMWCGSCGQPTVRCMGFSECGGLVGADGQCSVCVEPHLIIVPGATMHAPVGGSVALPFELMNGASSDRPIFITGLWSREKGDWREERLSWEELGQGERSPASVIAREIDKPGLHEIEIMFAVATRYKQREERFAFSSRILLTVQGEGSQAGPTIQISSENEMNGNVIQIHDNTSGDGSGSGKVIEAIDLNVSRLDLEEQRLGLRGMESGLRVRRSALFEFSGFPAEDHVPDGQPIMTPDGLLAFGRERARETGGGSDVRLLAVNADGSLDRELSLTISRRHFDVFIENDCLCLRVRGRNKLLVNGETLKMEERIVLDDGDRIMPLIDHPSMLVITVAFRREHNRVSTVHFYREPASEGTGQ
ncbi:FHA domain-containing protein [Pontixanthobacter aquaemixtae]|uniref:FHA domain-containing protein n=1 Tax=Pontixanthobacter aquaemixtae TaxID=1958940 RepID=A0A844ZVA6_9SPHN|nr:FHA domain-containing protein [Pontixanthobacter aquaemixtae]MXO91963.1 FHA domain-containing protein [Pontixanthobacter aquaemixtae]